MSSDNSKQDKQIEKTAAQKISKFGSFVAGGLAACIAVTVTNPIELIKIRMQLQGEMSASAAKVYKNPIQGMAVIFKNEGIKGLQKGLNAAYIYQIGLNGSRLGFYEPIRSSLNQLFFPDQEPHKVQSVGVNVFSGAASGIIGAVIGSPLFLVKTRLQSYSEFIKIGEQTHYTGVWNGLVTIFKTEGVKGLFRGIDAAILRTGAGSSVQLPIYNTAKNILVKNDLMKDGPALHLTASTISGLGVAVVMNPWDVILTRIYNQKGDLYKGPIDCLVKTVRIEGVTALYKGFAAQVFRIAPHTIMCLTFMEQTMKLVYSIESRVLGHN
ncbi:AQG_2a_G0032560.mRNA.1.CDS.1 [Saccharomyces cerevisiae]|uniref:Mitochondrial oxaloacetate transport protein n=10 Tax=Saccharomyces TaxID=4930 RepID=OAC1_YEAST|nr:Oac1p [Saccharomyces cerevisiae S288C]P32332.1 RecName: Full=Mitochondrial oxaloacetate transport protein; AltName: Full=Mitochondrial carrier protein PMT [Saccharomyces cerevisiae S288C]AAA34886.1 mitochondrial transporter protein [Saccharomyces cerevisiae]AHY76127.1 Oac1p [Saccharomyces cerevisiae YJM993]AJP39923.1 Oac1p [Saccharomyces cerevisiae YJM1078]AJS30119.1 Oac1p [Saccharomyces cerevisiae YJM189]AJS30421.1 Oac1p [Saccharomyces cerevisiae YJM193]AJS30721.1 Oac1p [Saccharomyces ce|eukprot:NP_012802.1 Oac1p [Saccharomyces cerevisiae S288C]